MLSLDAVLDALGIEGAVPMLGWVFGGAWADEHPELVDGFLRASYAAKTLLLTDDDAWVSVQPLMKAPDEAVFAELQAGYRAGVPRAFGAEEKLAIGKVAVIVDGALRSRGGSGADQDDLLSAFWNIQGSPGP